MLQRSGMRRQAAGHRRKFGIESYKFGTFSNHTKAMKLNSLRKVLPSQYSVSQCRAPFTITRACSNHDNKQPQNKSWASDNFLLFPAYIFESTTFQPETWAFFIRRKLSEVFIASENVCQKLSSEAGLLPAIARDSVSRTVYRLLHGVRQTDILHCSILDSVWSSITWSSGCWVWATGESTNEHSV